MTDLPSIVQALPAGTHVVILAATLPDGTQYNRVFAQPAVPSATPAAILPLVPPAVIPAASDTSGGAAGDGPAAELRAGVRPTALQLVRELKVASPKLSLKPKDWSKKLGHSAREIIRAVDVGAVPHTKKEDGRDHGAKMVRVGDMEAFLATIDAVERNRMDPPAWWKDVRGPKAWEGRPKSPRASA